jgi:hypothetical protein
MSRDIKQLLRFCLQRPSNCGLLGRDAIDADAVTSVDLPTFSPTSEKLKKLKGIVKLQRSVHAVTD